MTAARPAALDGAFYTGDVWRLLIVHRTEMTYPDTVTTSYNEVRMQPADEPGQAVLSARMEIEPFEGISGFVDYFGTKVSTFDVHRPHRHLSVTSTSTVETFPLDRLSGDARYSWEELATSDCFDLYEEYLTATELTAVDDELAGRAAEIRDASSSPSDAARAACELVRRTVRYETGATGVQTAAIEAWQQRSGVCQDYSHLVCALLRSIDIPARYVSGYLHPDTDAQLGQTVVGQSHAWVEWFDGAWTPFDPTNGAPPGSAHVVIGRGRDYRDVPPMKGVYAGPDATGNDVTVRVTRLR